MVNGNETKEQHNILEVIRTLPGLKAENLWINSPEAKSLSERIVAQVVPNNKRKVDKLVSQHGPSDQRKFPLDLDIGDMGSFSNTDPAGKSGKYASKKMPFSPAMEIREYYRPTPAIPLLIETIHKTSINNIEIERTLEYYPEGDLRRDLRTVTMPRGNFPVSQMYGLEPKPIDVADIESVNDIEEPKEKIFVFVAQIPTTGEGQWIIASTGGIDGRLNTISKEIRFSNTNQQEYPTLESVQFCLDHLPMVLPVNGEFKVIFENQSQETREKPQLEVVRFE